MLVILAAMALAAPEALPSNEPKASRIIVEGSGSAKNLPNVAEIEYEIVGEGEKSDQALKSLVSKSAAVERALRSMDAALDLHSTTVKVQSVRRGECTEEFDQTAHLSTGDCAIVGYVATQDFDLRTTRIADAGTMVGLASREGASNPELESFGLSDQRGAKQQAIAAALADARSKAEAVATGSNFRLGEVISISLDDALGGEEIVVTGSVRRPNMQEPPVTVSVAPGPVYTKAQVTVTYAIMR
jgi:uncharacterized protein YggE